MQSIKWKVPYLPMNERNKYVAYSITRSRWNMTMHTKCDFDHTNFSMRVPFWRYSNLKRALAFLKLDKLLGRPSWEGVNKIGIFNIERASWFWIISYTSFLKYHCVFVYDHAVDRFYDSCREILESK